jgi:hypothetical protein
MNEGGEAKKNPPTLTPQCASSRVCVCPMPLSRACRVSTRVMKREVGVGLNVEVCRLADGGADGGAEED